MGIEFTSAPLNLPHPFYFADLWIVGLKGVDDGNYVYAIARVDSTNRMANTWPIRIEKDFTSWTVRQVQ